ncbi:MAG: hypothetical protein CM15mP74_32050 [Halieaceae bacterium]|nr:MAG: hypothetical protein CM15mP74_32050 [Halieaceae bacterium]
MQIRFGAVKGSPRGMEYHVLKNRVLRAIVTLEFAGHVAEAVFPISK